MREIDLMTSTVTHFEIYGEHPVALADFYRKAFGWQVEQMEGIGYGGFRRKGQKDRPCMAA